MYEDDAAREKNTSTIGKGIFREMNGADQTQGLHLFESRIALAFADVFGKGDWFEVCV